MEERLMSARYVATLTITWAITPGPSQADAVMPVMRSSSYPQGVQE